MVVSMLPKQCLGILLGPMYRYIESLVLAVLYQRCRIPVRLQCSPQLLKECFTFQPLLLEHLQDALLEQRLLLRREHEHRQITGAGLLLEVFEDAKTVQAWHEKIE